MDGPSWESSMKTLYVILIGVGVIFGLAVAAIVLMVAL